MKHARVSHIYIYIYIYNNIISKNKNLSNRQRHWTSYYSVLAIFHVKGKKRKIAAIPSSSASPPPSCSIYSVYYRLTNISPSFSLSSSPIVKTNILSNILSNCFFFIAAMIRFPYSLPLPSLSVNTSIFLAISVRSVV